MQRDSRGGNDSNQSDSNFDPSLTCSPCTTVTIKNDKSLKAKNNENKNGSPSGSNALTTTTSGALEKYTKDGKELILDLYVDDNYSLVTKSETLTVIMRDIGGNECHCKLSRTTKLGNIMIAYSDRKNIPLNKLLFTINSTLVYPEDTAASLAMGNKDVITVETTCGCRNCIGTSNTIVTVTNGNNASEPVTEGNISNNIHSPRTGKRATSTTGSGDDEPPNPLSLVIIVRDPSGDDSFFKVNKTTKLKKLMESFANRKGVAASVLSFYHERDQVHPEDTPELLGMEDQDVLDVSVVDILSDNSSIMLGVRMDGVRSSGFIRGITKAHQGLPIIPLRVGKTTSIHATFRAYFDRKDGIDASRFYFMFGGKIILPNQTVESLHLKDGDVIVMKERS
eukprot:gene13603-18257_t